MGMTAERLAVEKLEQEEMLERLREVCEENGISPENKVLFTVGNDDFIPNIYIDDLLVVDKSKKPKLGEFALLSCNGKQQLILISGKSILGNDLVTVRYKEPLLTKEIISANYMGTVVVHNKNINIGENLGKTIVSFPKY